MDIRYPQATNHVRAFERAFSQVGSHSLTTSLGKCTEAVKIPGFKEMMEMGIPRPEPDVASYLTDTTIALQEDKHGRMREVSFPKGKPTHEASRKYANGVFKAMAQIGALNSSISFLNTAAEKMLRIAASPPGKDEQPTGLPAEFCGVLWDYMRLNAAMGIAIAQTAGFMAAASVIHTRKLWMDFVHLTGGASTIKMESITHADVGVTGLFGPGLDHIIARQEEFLDRGPALHRVLPRAEEKGGRGNQPDARARDTGRQHRDRSPHRQSSSQRPSTSTGGNTGGNQAGRRKDTRFFGPKPRNRGKRPQNQGGDRGGDRGGAQRAQQQQPPRPEDRQSFFEAGASAKK